jgi:N-hydroxyarylamine O-acetyltransferase
MSDLDLPDDLTSRYLRLLGVPRRPPSLDALREVVRAHVTRVPFENITKLLRFRRSGLAGIPDLSDFLNGIEEWNLGGTCYSNNGYLYRLLVTLGYDAILCGADMQNPDVHLVSLVRIDGRSYLVDGGYGAPFLHPMSCDLDDDYELVLGHERYVLRPRDAAGYSRLELYRNGQATHGYLVKPFHRRIEEFRGVIEGSFAPAAVFMNAVVITRFSANRSLSLHNLKLVESEGAESRAVAIEGVESLPEVIQSRFGVPSAVVREALTGLSLSGDPWG